MKNSSLSSNPEPAYNPYSEIKLSIATERLRQARQSFNLAWFTTLLCSIVTVGGAILLLFGTVKEGSITTAAGAISSVCSLKFAKDANDRLDKIPKEWKEKS
ncbi:hypothetical protein H6H03_29770 [Nostoc paludosum FACHB-159]|uniref:Cyanobacterial TRADD-N associated 2 transmembrane domain-containing protein n=2 Tax=Nostoc TaxID=1177 RepID=A0ABR8KGP1_9NOSO|nr:hypothetical protein [Nostoc sp. FACHB-857]MBD2738026.1 hypothetical protein [Nostoc paludosum FACHB-159]